MTPRRPLPRALGPLAAAGVLFLLVPLLGLLVRVPWAGLAGQLVSPAVVDALGLSLQCSIAAAALAFVLGVPLAAWLAAGHSRARTLVRVLVTLPMVLPPVVAGVALLLAYGRSGPLGLALPFTRLGVVVAETYVALPFLVLAAEAGLRGVDPRYGEAASTLGATPWQVFRTITLPLAAPSLRAGLLLAWARALGEFGATITFAGNLEGETRTLPLAVYTALETSFDGAIALSLLLIVVSAAVLFGLRGRWFPGPGGERP